MRAGLDHSGVSSTRSSPDPASTAKFDSTDLAWADGISALAGAEVTDPSVREIGRQVASGALTGDQGVRLIAELPRNHPGLINGAGQCTPDR